MAKVKNVSGEHRILPRYGLVLDGGTVEVPDDEVFGLTCQEPVWAPDDKAAKQAHDAATAADDPTPEGD